MIFQRQYRHIIPFHDIDIMHIVWHGHYYKYFEQARTALMQELDLDWPRIKQLGYAMPIVHSSAEYRKPLSYGQDILITASIKEYHYPALEIFYLVQSSDKKEVLVKGKTKQVYLKTATTETCLAPPKEIFDIFEKKAAQQKE